MVSEARKAKRQKLHEQYELRKQQLKEQAAGAGATASPMAVDPAAAAPSPSPAAQQQPANQPQPATASKSSKSKKGKANKAPVTPGAAAAATAAGQAGTAPQAGPGAQGRQFTVSIAVPASIIENAQTFEYANFIAGQIARAATAFKVDEVVVYDDVADPEAKPGAAPSSVSKGAAFLARVLQFLETPPYLRKALLPLHTDYRGAGQLPPLLPPHHLLPTEWLGFREGVVLKAEAGLGSFVDIGMDRMALVSEELAPNTRVTLKVGDSQPDTKFVEQYGETMILGELSTPSAPRQAGLYWGYSVRLAQGLSRVLRECPFSKAGYDMVVGTSENGIARPPADLHLPRFKHLLVAFGGPGGLEAALASDPWWAQGGEEKLPEDVFNMYLNTCPGQGGRVIATEDAVLISLAYLQPAISKLC